MNNDTFEQLFKTTKNMSAPLGDFGKALTEICQRTMQQNLEMMSGNFARASEQLKRMSRTQKMEDLLSVQKQCLTENVSATIENVQKILHTATENLEELSALCNSTGSQIQSAAVKQTKETIK